jgi:glycosyltransferase involved in cell wall biosynthesis
LKVLLIHQAFVAGGEAGGTRHFELGQHLAEQGDHMTVIASQINYLSGKPLNPEKGGLFYAEQVGPIAVLRAYMPPLHASFVRRVISFLVFMATAILTGLRAGPADVVMGTTPPIFQALSAWILARLRRKPFLLEVRDLWPAFAIDMGVLKNKTLIGLSRWLEGFIYGRADHFLVNSPAYRDYLIEKGVDPKKITFIANGVQPDMFNPADRGEEIRARFGLAGKFVVLYAGAHGMANDLGTLLKAADVCRDVPDIHFFFVGDGKERANLEQQAAAMALPNVTFAGALPKAQMGAVMAAADVCTAILMNIPMFTTTYPNKVFDYMAAGRPTLLAIDGVIRQVITECQGGLFVPPGDAAQMAQAVRALHADRALCQQMGQNARAHVVKHFNRADQAESFRALLHQLGGVANAGDKINTA